MCGRFTLTEDNRERVAAALGVPVEQLVDDSYRPRWNIAPTDPHWIVRMHREDREALPAKWGLVQFGSKDAKRAASLINARAETLAKRPAFRNAWRLNRRCVVPADGFFEWVGPKEARQPVWFHRPDGGIFFFAGLYESWQPTPDTWQRTLTIITTTPDRVVEPIHDRMPPVVRRGHGSPHSRGDLTRRQHGCPSVPLAVRRLGRARRGRAIVRSEGSDPHPSTLGFVDADAAGGRTSCQFPASGGMRPARNRVG